LSLSHKRLRQGAGSCRVKRKQDSIGAKDLEEYIADSLDFIFELGILRMLTEKGVQCEHSGQYKDPDTKKFREFDIRFRLTHETVTVSAAVECKAIGAHFPLLVSTVPRNATESYHQFFFHNQKKEQARGMFELPAIRFAEGKIGINVKESCLYPMGSPVGKSTAQVGRRETKDSELHANDADFFEKWSQALSSLDDLVAEISDENFIQKIWNEKAHGALALPIVVRPDGRLWSVGYDDKGQKRVRLHKWIASPSISEDPTIRVSLWPH